MSYKLVVLGALNLALVVMIGAFGAHGLKPHLSAYGSGIYQTAVHYHAIHALGILLIGALAPLPFFRAAAYMLQVGIILFCGSLYALAVTEIKMLGIITPFGGVAFIVGWLWLAWAAARARTQ